MNKFILIEGNNPYYKSYSLIEADSPLANLHSVERSTDPNRFSSTDYRTFEKGLKDNGFKVNVIIKSSEEPISGDYYIYDGYVGNY